tara:strand:- start:576 stop:1022 length:447 start_codon:yes stop_codon:yes gene_type:complete
MVSPQIGLRDTPFFSFRELQSFEESLLGAGSHGACSVFIGTMRDYNDGDSVLSMYLEHYPGMTEHQLEKIVRDTEKQYQLLEVFLLHRIGAVKPGEDIVLVAVWAVHRKDAFGACRTIMEQLKSSAPFWKKESLAHGDRWVKTNTPGE